MWHKLISPYLTYEFDADNPDAPDYAFSGWRLRIGRLYLVLAWGREDEEEDTDD